MGLSTPDYSEKRLFQKGRSSAEVLGMCKMTEEALTCWDPSGKLDEKLRSMVVAQLSTYNGQEVPIKFQRQNRILVIRQSVSSSPLDPDVRVYGSFYLNGNKLTSCPSRQLTLPDGSKRSSLELAYALSMPNQIRDVTVRFTLSEAVRDSAEMDCKVGSQTEFSGEPLKISAIDKVEGSSWSISIDTKLGKRGLDLRFSLLDLKDRTIAWVDQTGKPYSEAEYLDHVRSMSQETKGDRASKTNPTMFTRVVDVYDARTDVNQIKLVSRIDPKYVGKIAIAGRSNKLVEIGPVPLNPR